MHAGAALAVWLCGRYPPLTVLYSGPGPGYSASNTTQTAHQTKPLAAPTGAEHKPSTRKCSGSPPGADTPAGGRRDEPIITGRKQAHAPPLVGVYCASAALRAAHCSSRPEAHNGTLAQMVERPPCVLTCDSATGQADTLGLREVAGSIPARSTRVHRWPAGVGRLRSTAPAGAGLDRPAQQ